MRHRAGTSDHRRARHGAGVAGLQAIATARRLGAVVEAYDVRSATKEQVSRWARSFVDTGVSGMARVVTRAS